MKNRFYKVENIINSFFIGSLIIVLITSLLVIYDKNFGLLIKLLVISLLDNIFIMIVVYIAISKLFTKEKLKTMSKNYSRFSKYLLLLIIIFFSLLISFIGFQEVFIISIGSFLVSLSILLGIEKSKRGKG